MRELRVASALTLILAIVCTPSQGFAQAEPKGQNGATTEHQHAQPAGQPASEHGLLGGAAQQQSSERVLTLDELEKMALQGNPTLAQARARVRAAAGRKLQAGLYPNPAIGATGDENSPGPVIRGGEFGGFVEQRFVTAGKLRLERSVAEQEEFRAQARDDAQQYRVLNSIRVLYYQALGDQSLVQVREELSRITREAVNVTRQLLNVGQADQPDLLAAQVEARRADVALAKAKNGRGRTWRQLASMAGETLLQPMPLEGDLESLPEVELDAALAAILDESPELRTAEAGIARNELALRRARVEKIPDIVARGGIRYNRELLELGGRPVGLEGFFDVSVRIPIFNRNQGNVEAARAELEHARLERDRVRLSLRSRLAEAYKEYQDSLALVEAYRVDVLPPAQEAYDLYLTSFRQMAAAYPQVLIAQRNLFELREDYIEALVNVQRGVVEIRGLLLTGGLQPGGGGSERMAPADRAASGMEAGEE